MAGRVVSVLWVGIVTSAQAVTPIVPSPGPTAEPVTVPGGPQPTRADVATPGPSPWPPSSMKLDLGSAVIRAAIADAEREPPSPGNRPTYGAAAASQNQARIDRRFDDAASESCGGPGAFKFDPPRLGPIPLGGLLALPFLLHAVATGRCRPALVSPFAEGTQSGRGAGR